MYFIKAIQGLFQNRIILILVFISIFLSSIIYLIINNNKNKFTASENFEQIKTSKVFKEKISGVKHFDSTTTITGILEEMDSNYLVIDVKGHKYKAMFNSKTKIMKKYLIDNNNKYGDDKSQLNIEDLKNNEMLLVAGTITNNKDVIQAGMIIVYK